MPDMTPIYGFMYPCPGETVDATDFQTLANQIDAAFAVVEQDYDLALNRYNSDVTGPNQVFPAGVDTVVTTPQYTLPLDGVYVVGYAFTIVTPPATISSTRITVQQNGVAQFAERINNETDIPMPFSVSGAIVGAAGDVIRASFLYTGTGTYTGVHILSVKMLNRIA